MGFRIVHDAAAGPVLHRPTMWARMVLLLAGCWIGLTAEMGQAVTETAPCELVVVAHPDNPTPSLTALQVKQLFLGRLRLFPDTHISVLVLDLPHETPLFSTFYRQFTGMDVVRLSRYRSRYLFSGHGRLPESVPDVASVREAVLLQPGAVSYMCREDWQPPLRILFPDEHAVAAP